MKLIVREKGDSSVGIYTRYYELDCPFEKDEVERYDLEMFRSGILEIYAEYAETTIDVFYDFEDNIYN
jgi:hypothetical protein